MPRTATLMGVALIALTGCMSVDLWHQDGVARATASRDLLDCRVLGAQQVPPSIQTRTTPIVITPARTTCSTNNGVQTCTVERARRTGGETISYDSNEDLRAQVIGRCMVDRGYRYVSLPRCSAAEARSARVGPTLPVLQPQSCAAQTGAGNWTPVTPGT